MDKIRLNKFCLPDMYLQAQEILLSLKLFFHRNYYGETFQCPLQMKSGPIVPVKDNVLFVFIN